MAISTAVLNLLSYSCMKTHNLGKKGLRILYFPSHRMHITWIWYHYGPSPPPPWSQLISWGQKRSSWSSTSFFWWGRRGRGVFVVASAFKSFILKLDKVTPICLNILSKIAYIVSTPVCWVNVHLTHERNGTYCRMEMVMVTHVDLYSTSSHHLHSMFHSFHRLRWNWQNWHAPNVWVFIAIF